MSSSTQGLCSTCHQVFSDSDLLEFDSLPFCKEHYKILRDSKLKTLEIVETTPNNPELSVAIHDKQMALYKQGKIGYLKTEYAEKNGTIISVIKLIITA